MNVKFQCILSYNIPYFKITPNYENKDYVWIIIYLTLLIKDKSKLPLLVLKYIIEIMPEFISVDFKEVFLEIQNK